MIYKKHNLAWHRDYGDGEYTEDTVLWADGNPLNISISGAEGDGGYGALYHGNKRLAIADTRKELKEMLFKEFTDILDKEIASY